MNPDAIVSLTELGQAALDRRLAGIRWRSIVRRFRYEREAGILARLAEEKARERDRLRDNSRDRSAEFVRARAQRAAKRAVLTGTVSRSILKGIPT